MENEREPFTLAFKTDGPFIYLVETVVPVLFSI